MNPIRTAIADAWHLMVPPAGDKHGPLGPLLLAMTVVTGLVDAFSYLILGHVFVANMTGNVVFLGLALVGAQGFSIPASLLALAGFALGAFVGGLVIARLADHRGRLLCAAATGQVVLTLVALGVFELSTRPGSGAARYVLVAVLAVAMGVQNSVARRLAIPDLTTTVLTLTITGMAADARIAGGTGSRFGRRALSAVAMFLGALVGAAFIVHSHSNVTLVCAVILLAVVVVRTAMSARTNPSWAHVD